MRRIYIALSVFIFLLVLSVVIKPQSVHAACQSLSEAPVSVRADYSGQITILNIDNCFNPALKYDVFAWPKSDNSGAPVLGYIGDYHVQAQDKANLVVDFNLSGVSTTGSQVAAGIWNIWVCAETNGWLNEYDCSDAGRLGTTSILVNTANQPEPQLYGKSMQTCSFSTGSDVKLQVYNLIGNTTYYAFWPDQCNIFACPHIFDFPAKAPQGNPNAPVNQQITIPGSATQNPGTNRKICVDGFGLTRQDLDKNCLELNFYTGNVPPNPPACGGVALPPTPAPPINCAIKYNGVCGSTTAKCTSGYKPNPNGDAGGCNTKTNPKGICCVPNTCATTGKQCGVAQGSAYCCNQKDICQINSPPDIEPPSGTCSPCGNAGAKCNTQQLCCFPGFVCVYGSSQAQGTCNTCVQEGQTGCSATKPCCTTSDSCTNGGKCVASCADGIACTGNGDCCKGATCDNGTCHTPSPTPTVLTPSFPPVNWCQNGNCNTALGSWPYDPSGFIKTLFAIVLSLAGGIAVITIIYAGYVYMTSQGNPERLTHAQELITAAVVGLLFTIFSLVILQTIGVDLLHIPGITP